MPIILAVHAAASELVAVAAPMAAAPSPRADIGLFDALAVDIHLGECAAVAIRAVGNESDLAGCHQCLEPTLCRRAAGLVELGGVDVGQAYFSVIADQRVAVDRQATFARRRRADEH
jgi:hypothetical protein